MSARKRMPIGPLALAMRHKSRGQVVIAALIAGAALLAGLVLLLR